MNRSTHPTCVLAAALALCAASISSHAALKDDGAVRSAVAYASERGGIILAAQRGGGGARAGGGAREAAGNRAGAVNRQASGSRQVRSSATNNINHNRAANSDINRNINANVNRDVNVNRNVNIDRNVNVNRDYWGDWDDHWHPVATAAAVTATAVAVGAIVNSIPPNCQTVAVNGVSYSQCGSTWYQPQYAGTSVQYVVVNPPR